MCDEINSSGNEPTHVIKVHSTNISVHLST